MVDIKKTVTVMLVTSLCWLLYDNDRFGGKIIMLAAFFVMLVIVPMY